LIWHKLAAATATNTVSLLLCHAAATARNSPLWLPQRRLLLRVHALVVAAKIGTIRKGFAAQAATMVATGGQMDVAMLLPMIVGPEGLAAQVARVGPLVGVHKHMTLQLHHLHT
jgi:hypothetical protein